MAFRYASSAKKDRGRALLRFGLLCHGEWYLAVSFLRYTAELQHGNLRCGAHAASIEVGRRGLEEAIVKFPRSHVVTWVFSTIKL